MMTRKYAHQVTPTHEYACLHYYFAQCTIVLSVESYRKYIGKMRTCILYSHKLYKSLHVLSFGVPVCLFKVAEHNPEFFCTSCMFATIFRLLQYRAIHVSAFIVTRDDQLMILMIVLYQDILCI